MEQNLDGAGPFDRRAGMGGPGSETRAGREVEWACRWTLRADFLRSTIAQEAESIIR